ncbi:unnamed protein product [Linum tenue]|uniref:BHLH domain-containing protein n=1 Tax=Linum tenue TaxID=586396 RepID=A0AAV0JAY4_9ROSI|nr:unnamed protein product [Linum tenue]
MVSHFDNSNWVFDNDLINDLPVPLGGELPSLDPPVPIWSAHPSFPDSVPMRYNVPFNVPLENSECVKETGSRKRARDESSSAPPPPRSKACREKMRRDRLNDRFMELSAILEPGRPPKVDKSAILVDAARMVTQLRDEAVKLKESNESLQEKIIELKAEKSELRDEKQRLKTEKEQLERQVKAISIPPTGYLPHPHPMAAGSMGGKLMPFVGYPQMSMWQFMPPAAVDTSQDHSIRPPVA